MASLHRHYKSPYWYYAITLPDGRRTFRSTKQKKYKDALRFMLEQEKLNSMARHGVLTEVQARSAINDILEATNLNPIGNACAEDFIREWHTNQLATLSPNTHKRYEVVIEGFISFLGSTAKMPISSLERPQLVENFKIAQLKEGKSASTVNLSIKVLRSLFNTAKRQRLITINPAEETPTIRKAPNERKVFTKDQMKRLLEACKNNWEWMGMVLLGRYAGLRLRDAANLTWGNVDLSKGLLIFTPAKTKSRLNKKLIVPLKKELLDHLAASPIQSVDKKRPLFPGLYGKSTSGSGGLSLRFNDFLKKAGIDRDEQTDKIQGKGRRFFGLSFHSLRHTFVSRMRNSGIDQSISKKLAGHVGAVHENYTDWEDDTMRKAIEAGGRW